jgi:poly(3-hydroxybutyrate) depolymerase
MLYPYLDWQRGALSAALAALPGRYLLTLPGWPSAAALEVATRTLAAMGPQQVPLEAAVRRDAGPDVATAVLEETPFYRVIRFRHPAGSARRRLVLLTPHSGYAAAVLSPVVAALLPLGEVVAADWTDARLVPVAAGRFGLGEQVAATTRLLLGGDGSRAAAHVVAVSQAVPVALLAAAATAAALPSRPAVLSLSLLGGQANPSIAPRPVQQLLSLWPRALLKEQLVTDVPSGYPGVGRRVYPGLLQLLAFGSASPEVYFGIQHGLLLDLLHGGDRGFGRQHADIHNLIDVPAELFADSVDWFLGRPEVAGLSALASVPLLTVEAADDELVGAGQTHGAAAAIGTAATRHTTLTVPRGRHHDLFTGPTFLAAVAPALRRFVRLAEDGR